MQNNIYFFILYDGASETPFSCFCDLGEQRFVLSVTIHGCADRRHLENGTAADDSGVRREGMEQGQYGNWINLGAG